MPPEEVYKLGDLSKKTAQEMQQFTNRKSQHTPQPLKQHTAANNEKNLKLILKSRLVNGKINLDDYRKMKAELDK